MTKHDHILEARNGTLYFNGDILLCIYGAGDCDTIDWPGIDADNLEAALYDEYQKGLISEGDRVLLPDGQVFGRCEGIHFIMDASIR